MSISLTKGQKINLSKEDGTELTQVFMGLGWDAKTGLLGGILGGGSIDLDASCAMYKEDKTLVETVSFRNLSSRGGYVKHSGDNLTGAGDGDDEVINVDLTKVPADVKSIVFTINSFSAKHLTRLKTALLDLLIKLQVKNFVFTN